MAANDFEQRYPRLAEWLDGSGWLEIGQIDGPSPFIQVLDEGGVIWEGKDSYRTIDDALRDAERGVAAWVKENLGDEDD
jgi:hypothetical protein